jgi:hypothetical protein
MYLNVEMNPAELHKLAQESPSKIDLADYQSTVWELRRKGNSWRAIADFLIENGVKTDHSSVYRMMMESDPLFDYDDQGLIIGDQLYESQEGVPLRPFELGTCIAIVGKLRAIHLEHPERISSTWCQCQFQLSDAPNRMWLKKLHEELNSQFHPERPGYLRSQRGFELKFESNVMALDCLAPNLGSNYRDVVAGIERATKFFRDDKSRWVSLRLRKEARSKKILQLYHVTTETTEEIVEEHLEEYAKRQERLERDFAELK